MDTNLHGPLEEALAGLAGENAVVEPRDLVTTHLEIQHEAGDGLNNYHYSQSQPPPSFTSDLCSVQYFPTNRTRRVDQLLP